uniref:Ig-like domain-containing protein n=1 Tax=Chelydra serpentina TaxID=8475 RepID=A0A8C3XMY7_CHESE
FCGWHAGKCFFSPEQLSNPEFESLQKSLEVGIGQNVTLSCRSTNGSLPINYTFFRGNQNLCPIIPKEDRKPALFNLTISSASDLGEYKCKAVNGIANSSKYSKSLNFTLLDPVSKPVLNTTTSQVKIGQNVNLSCYSENGSSPINYTFFKGRKNVSSRIPRQGKVAAVLNVIINSRSDLGDYKCKAENNIPNTTKYSNSLNFTLAGMCLSYLLLIASDDELLMISACPCKLGYGTQPRSYFYIGLAELDFFILLYIACVCVCVYIYQQIIFMFIFKDFYLNFQLCGIMGGGETTAESDLKLCNYHRH